MPPRSKHLMQHGFTLIELMIVVAIIGILSVVSLSAYQQYTVRTQIAEILGFASGTKITLFETYSASGSMPADGSSIVNELADALLASHYVSAVDYQRDDDDRATFALITANLGGNMGGTELRLSFRGLAQRLLLACSSPDLPDSYLPGICRH